MQKGMKTGSTKKWILIGVAVVVVLAVVAAPVWALGNPDKKLGETLSEFFGYPDVATMRAALGFDPGPKCADSSGSIDADCLALQLQSQGAYEDIKSGEDLAAAWGITEEELEDALPQAIREDGTVDLEKLAELLHFSGPEALTAAVGLEDENALTDAIKKANADTEADQTAAETGETPAQTGETPAQTGETSTQADETPVVQNNEVITTESEQEAESGDASISSSVSNTGDYASQTAPSSQVANTGNFQNQVSVTQSNSSADDIAPEGISAEISPEQTVQSAQEVQQSAAADSSSGEPTAPSS
jgi:hypothetical protein